MSESNSKELLNLAVELGKEMLYSGAEIYRVQDTITLIMRAYNFEKGDVYVLSNGIFASADEDNADSSSIIRMVPLGNVNLGKIARLNQIARDLCNKSCTIEEARKRLAEVKNEKDYPAWLLILCCGIGSGAFCYMFGGSVLDACFATLIGFIEHFFVLAMRRAKISKFIQIVFAGALVSILALTTFTLVPSASLDKVIIGSIMPLVPGIAFTTAIRDFYNEDHLSGTIHLINAILIALCIAVGILIPMFIYQRVFGGILL